MADSILPDGTVQCPVCAGEFQPATINAHLDNCLTGNDNPILSSTNKEPPSKKSRISEFSLSGSGDTSEGSGTKSNRTAPMFTVFQHKQRSSVLTSKQSTDSNVTSKTTKRNATDVDRNEEPTKGCDENRSNTQISGALTSTAKKTDISMSALTLLNSGKPLAEKLRPNTLEEYFGQNKVLGQHTLLRSLLDSQEIPSLILWGPPGCGKTTLAHIIASSSKKNGTVRFVTLSATSTSTNEVREVIKQAQNELRLFKRKTVLFIDEIHRFNKSQQDTFLPHVECGTVTLIGATTENPSFQVNSALLSRCRVIVLERLSVEAMGSILNRAVDALGIRVVPVVNGEDDRLASAAHQSEPQVYIEQKALDTIAHLCDGDARAGLNGLQLAVQARVAAHRAGMPDPSRDAPHILIQEDHVKEGLQRSHILYDKAGEEHYNCISALHKSLRGSHENAALYWLGRMLEGGEDPLYVARRLVRFASEDIGLADPAALPQAVSAFQACHFIGMPECEVILAQCVVYLARAPKSVDVYKAYSNVKACLRNHRGPLPPVPLHLRNAPTRLMKDLGYAKGYKYNPAFSSAVEQEYLPEELRGMNFFTWTPTDQ
ncbi:ATPase WRNIP1 [Alosa sapidissima]|uniref:ATPase WRNIP1 n=1 Tax=Alosa sapidissima TaxID=34773 RepID=UPI001C08BA39|nr:ATPase WRNIP1 [Alosa sapidissima]